MPAFTFQRPFPPCPEDWAQPNSRWRDQLALDEFFVRAIAARQHIAEAAYAAGVLPMEIF